MKDLKYYDFLKEKFERELQEENSIKSDFYLMFALIFEFLIFLVKLPFYLMGMIFYFVVLDFTKANKFLMKIFSEPFVLFSKISNWFFEAKWTAYLICFLIIVFIFEFLVLVPTNTLNYFLFSSKDLFDGRFFTVITSIFLHANLTHITGNLIALLVFGRIVERQLGAKVLFLFLGSGIFANIVSGLIYYMQGDYTPALGASGGIAGLIIFAILLDPFAVSSVFLVPLPIFALGWFLIFLDVMGLTNPGPTNHLAHLSGYMALLFFFFFLEFKHRNKIMKGFLINFFLLILVYFVISYFGIKVLIPFA